MRCLAAPILLGLGASFAWGQTKLLPKPLNHNTKLCLTLVLQICLVSHHEQPRRLPHQSCFSTAACWLKIVLQLFACSFMTSQRYSYLQLHNNKVFCQVPSTFKMQCNAGIICCMTLGPCKQNGFHNSTETCNMPAHNGHLIITKKLRHTVTKCQEKRLR